MAEGSGKTRQRGALLAFGEQRLGAAENARVAARVERKAVLVVAHREASGVVLEAEHELAAREHIAIVVAQCRHQHLALELSVDRMPLDVKVLCVGRGWPVFQHVHPPGVVGAEHAHVVGHHVEQQSQAVFAQRSAEALEALGTTELRVDLVVRDNVVAVHAARTCAQDRRAVHVAHPEARKVRQNLRRVVEGEILVELQPVGRARYARLGRGRAQRRMRANLCEYGGEIAQALAHCELFERHRQLALPVRMLLGGARHVGLLGDADRILDLHDHHARGRRGDKSVNRLDQCRGERLRAGGLYHYVGRQASGVLERKQQAYAFLRPVDELLLVHTLVREQSQFEPHLEIAPRPPSGKRCEIVRAHRHQRVARILGARLEPAAVGALEVQQPVGEHLVARERGTHFIRNRAEVFANDHATVALALERDDRHHFFQRIMHVGAIARGLARRNPIEAHEPHYVIDAQRTCVAHVLAQCFNE